MSATVVDYAVFDCDRLSDPAGAIYCSDTRITHRKPTGTLKSGSLGTRDADSVDRGVLAALNGPAQKADHPAHLDSAQGLSSPATRVFFALPDHGSYLVMGAELARITH